MKKLTAALLALTMTFSFTGCTENSSSETGGNTAGSAASDNSASGNTEQSADGSGSSENAVSNQKFGPVSGSLSPEDAAQKLLMIVNDGDRVAACAINKVVDSDVTVNGMNYLKVDSSLFTSAAEIDNYFSVYFSAEKYSSMSLTSGDIPVYMDIENHLYVLDSGRGCGYSWSKTSDGRIETMIADETEDSFTVYAPFDHMGQEERAEIRIIKEDGSWKIDSYGMVDDLSASASDGDVFAGKWENDKITLEIRRNSDRSYTAELTRPVSITEKVVWSYLCYYNSAAGTLDSSSGNKETFIFSDAGVLTQSNMEGGQSASFYITDNVVQWIDNSTVGNSIKFSKAD